MYFTDKGSYFWQIISKYTNFLFVRVIFYENLHYWEFYIYLCVVNEITAIY
jgi:hypothetical protein